MEYFYFSAGPVARCQAFMCGAPAVAVVESPPGWVGMMQVCKHHVPKWVADRMGRTPGAEAPGEPPPS